MANASVLALAKPTHNIKVLKMSMSDRDGVIWFDGKLVPWRDANVHVLTHSLHYGMGVFEGIRAYKTQNGTAIFRLKEHVKRLFNGCLLYTSPSPRDLSTSRMPSSA